MFLTIKIILDKLKFESPAASVYFKSLDYNFNASTNDAEAYVSHPINAFHLVFN